MRVYSCLPVVHYLFILYCQMIEYICMSYNQSTSIFFTLCFSDQWEVILSCRLSSSGVDSQISNDSCNTRSIQFYLSKYSYINVGWQIQQSDSGMWLKWAVNLYLNIIVDVSKVLLWSCHTYFCREVGLLCKDNTNCHGMPHTQVASSCKIFCVKPKFKLLVNGGSYIQLSAFCLHWD